MDTVLFLNNHSSSFVHFAWIMLVQSSILILVLTGIDLLLRKKVRAVFRYCLWMLLLVKLVLPVGLALPYSPAYWASNLLLDSNVIDDSDASSDLADFTPASVSTGESIPYRPVEMSPAITPSERVAVTEPAAIQPPIETSADAPIQQTKESISWKSFAALGWLVAVLIMLGLLIQRVFFVRSLIRQSKLADDNLLSQLKQCASKMGMRRKVDIRISPNATSPSVCGLIQPVILMPADLSDHLSKNQIDAILMHELAHIKRGDLWINLVQALLQITYFYNPLLWVANAVIRRIREQAVDEMVLVAMDDRAEDYPETLLHVSKLVWNKPMLSLRLIGVVESKSALTSRIKHILSRPFPKSAKLGIAGLAAIILTAAILLPMAKGARLKETVIPIGKELSQVHGISIIKNETKGQGRSSSSSSSDHSHSRQTFKSEKLPAILKRVSKDYPVKFKKKLPRGYYGLNAKVDGSERMLLEEVCAAFSQSFDLDVSIQPYKQKVMVLSCDDPAKLKIKKSDRDLSCGFYKQEKNEDGTYTQKFIAGLDELVKFARRHVLVKNDYKITLVNETNLEGLYEGSLRWSLKDEDVLLKSLKEMGLSISKAKREVETVVVAKKDSGKDYTKQRLLGSIKSKLILKSHKYHEVGQDVYFSINSKYETKVKFDKFPRMFIVLDGKSYKSGLEINPYSSGDFKFGTNNVRGREKPELSVGKHTAYVSIRDFDVTFFRDKKSYVKELRSNEIDFEVVNELPESYFKEVAIENGKEVLDDCHIKMLYLISNTSDNTKEYTEIITLKGYTPPFNLAAKAYLESESGKKVFIKDLAIVSRVGEVVPNNTFSHSYHKDFNVGESLLNPDDLLSEKWRVVLEPSRQVAQSNPLIRSYYGQKYLGPYQDIQMKLNSFGFDDAGFTHKSSSPLSNYQGRHAKTLDMDTHSSEFKKAELKFDKEKSAFRVISENGASAVKLKKTFSVQNLKEQMTAAVDQLFSGKGNVETIEVRDNELHMYAIRSSKGKYFLLTINGIEHNQNGSSFGNSSNIQYSRFKTDKDGMSAELKQAEMNLNSNFSATLPNGVTVELLGVCENPSDGKQWWKPDGSWLSEEQRPYKKRVGKTKTKNKKTYESAFKLVGAGSDDASISIAGHGGIFAGYGKGIYCKTLAADPEDKAIDLEVGIACQPWTTKHEEEVVEGGGMSSMGDVTFGRPIEKNGKTVMTVSHSIDTNIYQVRLIAIDKDGNDIATSGSESAGSDAYRQITTTFNLPIADIKAFRVQTRKYEWVTFKNVSLRHGGKTDVEIEVDKATDNISDTAERASSGDSESPVRDTSFGGLDIHFGVAKSHMSAGKNLQFILKVSNLGNSEKKLNVLARLRPLFSEKHDRKGTNSNIRYCPVFKVIGADLPETLAPGGRVSVKYEMTHIAELNSPGIKNPAGPGHYIIGMGYLEGAKQTPVFVGDRLMVGNIPGIENRGEMEPFFTHYNIKSGDENFKVKAGFIPAAAVIELDQKPIISFIVENLSKKDFAFAFGGDYRALARPDRFKILVYDDKGNLLPDVKGDNYGMLPDLTDPKQWRGGGKATPRTVLADDMWIETIDADQFRKITKPGTYTIRCRFMLSQSLNTKGEFSELVDTEFKLTVKPKSTKPSGRKRIDAAKWSEGRAVMGTIATAIRAYFAENQIDGSWTQDDLTLEKLGFMPGDLTCSYFSEENFSWKVSYSKSDRMPKFTITATAGKGITSPALMTIDHTGKQIENNKLSLFESYFPEDAAAGKELTQLWNSKGYKGIDEGSFFELFRKGIRTCTIKHKVNFPMQHIGSNYIWHKKPNDQRAVDIVYHASFSPDFKYYAVYSGLSVANPKSKIVLKRLVDIAMEPHQLGRIAWGVKQSKQKEEFMALLSPYLKSSDVEIRQRAEIVGKAIKGEIDAGKWEREYHQKQQAQKTVSKFGDDLPKLKKTLLTGTSKERREAINFINKNSVTLYQDKTFIAALGQAAKDKNANVRAQTAHLLGGNFIWGKTVHPDEAVEILLHLAKDEDREVRNKTVYYGLSNLTNMTEAVVKQLIEMATDPTNEFGRISWGLGRYADKEVIKKQIKPYLGLKGKKGELAKRLYKEIFNEEPLGS